MIVRTVSGETLLVPIRGQVAECDRIFILNETGSFLWSHLDGSRSVDALAELVGDEFEGANAEATRSDVESFLSAMDERGLITWVRGS